MPFISVIMPVYNAEAFLAESVGSVLTQTFGDFELICFNDASTDGSSSVLHSYARLDGRVKIIDSAVNIKQGGGRNRALDVAGGEYVIFLDADDRLDTRALEECVAIVRRGADAVFFDYVCFTADGVGPRISPLGPGAASLPVSELRRRLVMKPTPLWTGMYRRNLIEDGVLRFPEGVFYEDNAVALAIQLSARRPKKLDCELYCYRTDNTSVTRSTDDYRFFDRIASAETLLANLRRLGLYDSFAAEIDYLLINQYLVHTVYGAIYRFSRVQTDRIAQVCAGIDKLVPDWRRNPYWLSRSLRERFKFAMHVTVPRFIKLLSVINRRLKIVKR